MAYVNKSAGWAYKTLITAADLNQLGANDEYLKVFIDGGLHALDTDASHYLIIKPGSNLSADRILTITTGDAARTLTIEADSLINQDLTSDASPTFAGVTLGNSGLHILDTNASHDLIITPGSDLSADRILTIITGDAARTLTIEADSLINQDLTSDASPTFLKLTLSQATGTAPLTISSTTVVANLNADLWDGYQFVDYLDQALKTSSAVAFAGVTSTVSSALETTQLTVHNNFGSSANAVRAGIGFNANSVQFAILYGGRYAGGTNADGVVTLHIRSSDSMTERFRFFSDGTGYADVAWSTFSPDIKKELNIINPTAKEYLLWALSDAKKPVKPYAGIPLEKEERDKYAKDISKIAIGVAIWAESAEERIAAIEEKISKLLN